MALCWGSTNPFIKKGTAGLEQISQKYPEGGFKKWVAELFYLLTRWQVKTKLLSYYYSIQKSREPVE